MEVKMQLRIGVITHYREMEDVFKHLYEKLDCVFIYRVGALEYAIGHAVELQETQKVDAIISGAATIPIIADYVDIPVIPLHIKNYDLVKAFHKAHMLTDKIAYLEFRENLRHYDFNQVVEILGYEIRRYQFQQMKNAEKVVNHAVANGCKVIVTTGNVTYAYAKDQNLEAIMVLPDEREFVSAVGVAKNMIRDRKKEGERNRWLNEIVHTSAQGIITIDNNEHITVINAAAENMLNLLKRNIVGQNINSFHNTSPLLEKVLAVGNGDMETIQDGENEYIVSKIDLTSDDDQTAYLGSIFKINELKNIQCMEMSARKKISETGFIAHNTFQDIVGTSPAIKRAKDIAKRYSQTDSIILINGETGSGKELFAQSIHNYSIWKNGPFVAINCSTLSANLLESELFGYDDGAFTGAKKGGRPGLFEIAHNGTFFLDEIGEIPLQLQAKLLRVLQERCVMRIGGSKNIPVKVRIILATNRDLYAEVKAKRFREDLYYRINVLNLRLPPLRERKKDIPPIVQSIIKSIKSAGNVNPYISSEVVATFMRYDWFGNVRELSNFVERLTALNMNDIRSVNKMLDELIAANTPDIQPECPKADSSHLTVAIGPMREMEKEIIKKLYEYYGGNKRKVESALEMSSTTLWRRFKTIQ